MPILTLLLITLFEKYLALKFKKYFLKILTRLINFLNSSFSKIFFENSIFFI